MRSKKPSPKTVTTPNTKPTPTPKEAPTQAAAPVPAPAPVVAPAETEPKRERKPAAGFADINVQEHLANTIVVKSLNEDGTVKNPKRAGSAPAARFARYGVGGITVKAALEAGVTEADVRWDIAHEFIALQ